MREDRNQFQIIRKDARNCFVESLNDSFSIGRIHLAFAAYDQSKPAGQRQTNNVHIYIAVDAGQQSRFPVCCRLRPRRNQRKGLDRSEIR